MRDEVELYVAQGSAEGWSPKTVVNYRDLLLALTDFLRRRGCRRFGDVAPADLDAFMQHLLDLGRAKASRTHHAGTVRRFFRWLQERGRVVANPARQLPVPDDGEEDLPAVPLTEEQVQAFFDALPRATPLDLRNAAVTELLYGCGLRVGEAVALDLRDVDLVRGTVHVREGKGGQERLLPLLSAAASAVRDWIAVRRTLLRGPDHGALFLSGVGRRLETNVVRHWLDKLNAERGPHMTHLHPHAFRHAAATHLLRGGMDVRAVQEWLGHASLDTTRIYLSLVPGRLKEDYERAIPEIEVGYRWAGS